ncbi:MAG: CRISPR-associated endonuclease Cas2 [Verrucomicrobiales bacterium]|nr:CRISPR-associated endonuclease Cas2 [Verrucomicrobiales bacterium]
MSREALYLAVYDVSEDRERNAVAKVLEGFGIRVQKSAFECRLTRGSRATLERRLESLRLQSGFVLLYRLQARSTRAAFGAVPDYPLDDCHYAIVI